MRIIPKSNYYLENGCDGWAGVEINEKTFFFFFLFFENKTDEMWFYFRMNIKRKAACCSMSIIGGQLIQFFCRVFGPMMQECWNQFGPYEMNGAIGDLFMHLHCLIKLNLLWNFGWNFDVICWSTYDANKLLNKTNKMLVTICRMPTDGNVQRQQIISRFNGALAMLLEFL